MLSYYVLVTAAQNSGDFQRIGPVWVRRSLEDIVEYSNDGNMIINDDRIEPREWTAAERAHQSMPGSKRLRSQAKTR